MSEGMDRGTRPRHGGVDRDGATAQARPDAGAGRASRAERDDRTVGSLIRELGEESSALVRQEVALAKAEMREKLGVYERNAAKIAIGGVLLLGAGLILLVAVNRGLTSLFAQFMDVELAVWIAPLVLAGVAGLIGWSMVKAGKTAIAREGVAPRRTMEVVRSERDWVKREVEEAKHGER